MPKRPVKDALPDAQKRLTKFLNCVARLIAKRALREQQQDDDVEQRAPVTTDEEANH